MTKKTPRKTTAGKAATDLLQKDHPQVTVMDQQEGMQEDYMKELALCADAFSKKHPFEDFFIAVLIKNERLLENVFRTYFIPRMSCPTPNYDQAVYRYRHASGDIEFVWVIPSREACIYLKEHVLDLPPDHKDLMNFVMSFSDGTLYQLCRHLNKEMEPGTIYQS